ncbi:MAG: hypothetical protein FWD09_00780 [Lentimicrobiaceae bacterium]|nr:hypothetical protein [Lentimicrobiaceae bacterium]
MPIKIIKLLCCLLLISTTAWSQKNELNVLYKEKVFGKNLMDGTDIKGVEFIFPERIDDCFLDPETNFLTVQLRGLSLDRKWLNNTGSILQYDLKNKKVLWDKFFSYTGDDIIQFNKILIYSSLLNSYKIDPYSGKSIWKTKNRIFLGTPRGNIGIAYKFDMWLGGINKLEGVDLMSGKKIWTRKIYQWDRLHDAFFINDSTLMVIASGLNSININTGKGWAFYMSSESEGFTGLMSNVLIDSNFIYMASQYQIVKLNKNSRDVVWKHPFRHNLTTVSSIFMDDSAVYMINRGFGFKGKQQRDCGRTFIAAFNKQTGEQKYFTLLDKKDGAILGFRLVKDEVYLLFQNKIATFNFKTGNGVHAKEFPKEDFDELRFFIGEQVFIDNQHEHFFSLVQNDSTNLHVLTIQNKIISVNNQLNVMHEFEIGDVYVSYLHVEDYQFIAKDNKTFIINDTGKKIAELEASKDAFLMDNVLYDTRNRSFIAIDLKGVILPNENY